MHDRAVGVVPLAQTGQSVGETRRIAANIAKLLELLSPTSDERAEKKAVGILD